MDSIAKFSADTAPAADNKLIVSALAILCGLTMVVFACMATNGLDTSAGLF